MMTQTNSSDQAIYFLNCDGDIVFASLPGKPEKGGLIEITEATKQVIWRGDRLDPGRYKVENEESMGGDFATHPTLNKLYTIIRYGS